MISPKLKDLPDYDLQMAYCKQLRLVYRRDCRRLAAAPEDCIGDLESLLMKWPDLCIDAKNYINCEIAYYMGNLEAHETEVYYARAANGGELLEPEEDLEMEVARDLLWQMETEIDSRFCCFCIPDKEELCGGEGSDEDEPEEWGETGEPYHGGGPEAGEPGNFCPIDRAKCLDDLSACIPAPIPGCSSCDPHDKDHYQHCVSLVKALAYKGPEYHPMLCALLDTQLVAQYETLKKALLTLCDYYGHNPAPSPAPAQAVALLLRQSDIIFTPQPDGGVWGPEM